ncbi:MAG TPA: SNF2-related protein, partial [Chlamydiales bacterium]|nr:SNF2-related protein [Chlamydiales bacterium]
MKKENRGRLPLHPGLRLKKEEIPSFLTSHKEDLEQVQGFFTHTPIIQQSGLEVRLNDENLISLSPRIEYRAGINPSDVQIFGDFAYLAGHGFSEMPSSLRLPERYREPLVIPSSGEATFLAYELEPLKPFILKIDPRLQKSAHLKLKIRKIKRDRRKRTGEWLIDLVYESDLGTIDIFSIWDAFQGKKKHLFSPAGLISLKDPRFNWLRQLPKRRLDRKKGMLRINTLEWIRLSVFEEITTPKGNDPESVETRKLLEELQRFETHRLLDISKLKAQLRPYQELGLQWLWFLYCHGLSGLLCDDMGLGKTHQAMALLAAVTHEDQASDNKYLVVCPTSVIYHWQELLKKFLPTLRVCTYYGLARTLDQFDTQYDLLLTSYGILRTGKETLSHIRFEVAIFDEIQIAKNSASQTHRALRSINSHMRLGLTGTPIENRIREIKSLIDVVLPGYMPSEAVFREIFVTPIEKGQDDDKKILLGKLIKPFILRRKKSEVLLDLPEKIEEVAYCDLSPEQKNLYTETARSLRNTVYADLKDTGKPVSYVHVFSALSKLKRICDHPSLIFDDTKRYFEHESGKWDLFVELIHEARDSGQKVVVFSQYLDMLAIIEEYLKKKGIGF